jgi:phosphoribosylaminoimidazole-succinocarboxamide synthase
VGEALWQSNIAGYPCRRGKVRDIYDLGEQLVIVATDRISAFDWVMPTPIPNKGVLLTQLTLFWLAKLNVPNHLISADLAAMPQAFQAAADQLTGRTMLVRKAEVVPFECVVRGYLAGSGWRDYTLTQSVCGVALPSGLRRSERLPEPIFTPATKALTGHDENVSFERMAQAIGSTLAEQLRQASISLYRTASEYAAQRGVLIADTKFEWGLLPDGSVILIDEVLTPDSSRFWPAQSYRVGQPQPSLDKQPLRDWLESSGWDKRSPPPELPAELVEQIAQRYRQACDWLMGTPAETATH